MFDGNTQTRTEAVELVADARIQAATGDRSFAFLMGLRDTLYAWLAEVELELRKKVVEEPFGYFAEGAAGEAYEEMVIGDPRVSAELTSFFEAGEFSDPADSFESTDPSVALNTFEPAVVDRSESEAISHTPDPPVDVSLESEATSHVPDLVEAPGDLSPLPLDTRQVSPCEWPTGMVPTESGVGWRRGEEADDSARKQAAVKAFEVLLRGGTLRELGRLMVGRRRAGT
jgi:hypothetical protein